MLAESVATYLLNILYFFAGRAPRIEPNLPAEAIMQSACVCCCEISVAC